MTDQELLTLVQDKTPEELSLEEIDLLRARLAESSELREALFGQMQMEAYLAEALGRVHVSPQEIIARAHQTQGRFQLTVPLVCVVLVVPVFLLLGAALWNAVSPKKVEVVEGPKAHEKKGSDKKAEVIAAADQKNEKTVPGKENGEKGVTRTTPRDALGNKVEKSPTTDTLPATGGNAPPAAPVNKDPWLETMALQGDLPRFQDVAFQDFDTTKSLPRRADLQRWFEPVPGQNYRIVEVDTQRGRCGVLEGSARLRAPWTKDSSLKFAMENYKGLVVHFYHGLDGITLAYYQDAGDKWAAWKTTRKPGGLRPETLALTATDDDRARRTEVRFGGPMEIRWRSVVGGGLRGGELIFSRGDVVLLTAPIVGIPEDVYFEGRATFLGIAVKRSGDDPVPLPSAPISFATNKPAELAWQLSKPDISFERLPEGAVRLSTDKEKAQAFIPLPYTGLGEVILELDGLTPGSGVYLGKELGAPQEVVRFMKNTKDGRLGVKMTYPDDTAEFDLGTLADRVVPTVPQHCWIKLLMGCGNFRWWVSCDGQHWAQPEMAVENTPGNRAFLGLQVVANRPGVQMTLKRIEFRELAGLSSLAVKDVRDKAPVITTAPTIGFWFAEIARRQPAGVDPTEWRRACAIRSLGGAPPRELAYALLELLLDDAAARKLPLVVQLAALDDAALLVWDFRDGQAMKVSMGRRYLELGQRKYEEEGLPPWSSIRQHAMSVPVATWLQQPANPDVNLRWELIQAATNRKPDDTMQLLRQIRFFQQQQFAPLADWAEATARRDLPGRAAGDLATRLKDGWRHPLVEELSKETYNSLTELQAVLESEAWQDAARMVTSLDPEAAPGVAPYHKDKDLLVSLPVAVRLTLADYPQLKQALGQQFGTLAKLRIGQAIAGGDASALELATVQFAGTEAAAEAHRWLGDRALSSGWFERAIAEYRRSTHIQPAFASDIAPRLRLAAAMLGQDAEQPVTKAVAFGEVKMTKEQFEALVAEMRSRGNSSLSSISALAPPLPSPTNLSATLKAKLDGPLGANPQEEVGRRTTQFRVPWADRQIATVLEGDLLYVTNRFQVAAYNLASGQRLWQSVAPPGAMAKAQDWAMIAMKPLVTQSHVYARLLYGPSPLLVCLEKATGKIVWTSQHHDREFLVSDPVLVQGQLASMSISLLDQQEGQLKWNLFDAQTGELTSQKDLVRLRSTWGSRGCCEITPLEDAVVAALGGVTFSCDVAGNLKWVRRQTVLPADEEPRWILQLYQRPLVEQSRLYVAQPGVRGVDCLDVHSGARNWTSSIPDIVGIIGIAEDKLLVRTETDVRALDKATGKFLWRRELSDPHSFALCSGKSLLIAQREPVPIQNNLIQNRLTWLETASGDSVATTVLPNLNDPDPRLGPLVQYKDRIWTFFGKGQTDPTRDLVEFAPAGEAEKLLASLPPLEQIWSRNLASNQQAAARKFLPDWQLLASSPGDRTGLMPEAHGEKDVLGLRATAISPVVFSRQITLPGGGKPRLRIRVGNDPGQNWKLLVSFGDKQLHAVDITDATHPDRYKQLEIDLSPVAGQSGNLVVQAQFVSTGDATALFWKALEVLF
ncbi:MAG: PQQ-binding-like beta-propeller repeat protein [Pirellulaceae bacterium]